jgi:2Fe-2S ferredoxin
MDALSAMRPEENAMLDSTISERRPNSRLSCQIKVTNELDGALFYLPEHQV